MKSIFTALFAIAFYITNAQTADSIVHNPLKPDIDDRSWCISFNTGVQKRLFFGAGIAKTVFIGSGHGIYGSDVYTGINFFPTFNKSYDQVAAIKLGSDLFGNMFFLGAEVQYLKSKGAEDWLFTPRTGIGISNLYFAYGYSISANKFPVAGISQNSITLQVNFPYYTKDKLTNRVSYWNRKKKKK